MIDMPDIKAEYSETYKRINVGGIFGGISPRGLEGLVYSEERRGENVIESIHLSPNKMYLKRTVECELIIDPMQMKSIYHWLGEKIKEYEKIFGRIPSPEELDSRVRKDSGQ